MDVACKPIQGDATWMWHPFDVSNGDQSMTKVRKAVERLGSADEELKAAREDLADAIADALRAGIRPTDLEREVPYKREHIRRIARAHNLPPLREPTVVSKRKSSKENS